MRGQMAGRLSRLPADHWLVPIVLGALVLAILVAASLLAPAGARGVTTLAAGSGALLIAFLLLPRPALLVFALVMLLHDTLAPWLGGGIRQIDEVVVPATLAISAWRLRPFQRGLIEPVREGLVAAVLLLGVTSSVVNGVPPTIWLVGLLLAAKVFAFMYVVLWHDFSRRDVLQFAPAVIGLGLVVVALGYVELIDPVAFGQVFGIDKPLVPRGGLPSIESIFYHPMLLGWFSAFVALFFFAYYVVYRRWWLLAGALLFSVTVVLSARRRAIAGLVFGLAGGFAHQLSAASSRRERLRAWAPVGLSGVLLSLAFLPSLLGLLDLTVRETTPPVAGEAGEQNARLALYRTSVLVARDHFPLGAGFGRFGSAMSRVEYSPLYYRYGLDRVPGLGPDDPKFVTDTFWPKILGETGVFGLLAYVAFAGVVGLSLWRAAGRLSADPFLRAFGLAALMVFLQALVETLASSMFQSPNRTYLLFGAVGVALALARAIPATVDDGASTKEPEEVSRT